MVDDQKKTTWITKKKQLTKHIESLFISIPQSFREISHWEIINEDYTLR